MQEDFLHYIWKFKKFDFGRAVTVDGLPVFITSCGVPNLNEGPDFFNAHITIGDQVWAGNVEIHIKSSYWYAHHHEIDPNYDNVILHVVWEDDVAVFNKNNKPIPTLELKHLVEEKTMQDYRNLLLAPNAKWINCEKEFFSFDQFNLQNWLERIYLEKLEKRFVIIQQLLKRSGNNWEAVLFMLIAKNFGLKINGPAFLSMAQSLDFKVIQKTQKSPQLLEALLFGQSGLLDQRIEDGYFLELENEYSYLKRKFQLENNFTERPKFFRLRPDNFPTIRLSQLAMLYSGKPHFFSEVLGAGSKNEMDAIFKSVKASGYWDTHFNFEKSHGFRTKKLTQDFIDLQIINTVIPMQFYYFKAMGNKDFSYLLNILDGIKTEKNSIIQKFNKLRPQTAKSALHSQALLHLKTEYCDKNGCLRCNLGVKLLQGYKEN